MEIQPAFNSGVQGLQKATESADKAATDIAVERNTAETSAAQESTVASQASTRELPPPNEQKIPDLNQSIVDLKVAEHQAKASTQVIKTADDSLGTLLDVTA